MCTRCPQGRVSKRGAFACETCKAGTYQSSTACVDCRPGAYQRAEGATTCDLCDFGRFTSEPQATQCNNCAGVKAWMTTLQDRSQSVGTPVWIPFRGSTNESDCRC